MGRLESVTGVWLGDYVSSFLRHKDFSSLENFSSCSYSMTEFVEGWTIIQTLGEGSYGEVKLLMNPVTGSVVAMKAVNLQKHPNVKEEVKKEVFIHSSLVHSNIIKYYGQRQDDNYVYIFLEYAEGGELFDRIEPDSGTPHWQAQKYFLQLLNGVEYLHNKGIAHRDLKPENLLLDSHDNLKITDFGMATVFRIRNKERMLDKKCGTLPYVAPEVLSQPYQAEPADVWSCGIILVALLAGELPWDQPNTDCKEYVLWKTNQYAHLTPWSKIDTLALSLIRKVLVPLPSARYNISKIKAHRWCIKRFIHTLSNVTTPSLLECKQYSASKLTPDDSIEDERLSYSQPQAAAGYNDATDSDLGLFSFSQPTQIDNLLLSTQLMPSQAALSSGNSIQKLVHRMTRFFVQLDTNEVLYRLSSVIDKLGYRWKSYAHGVVTVSTVDRRKSPLTFKANILIMGGQTLLDFRLSKGCGLEFKRCFIIIKQELDDVVIKGPVTWPIVIATNCIT